MSRQNFNFHLLGYFPLWNKRICFILDWGTLLERENNCWTFTQFVDWFIWMVAFVCAVCVLFVLYLAMLGLSTCEDLCKRI